MPGLFEHVYCDGARGRETLEEARRLSDEEALVQYYNNLAVNALVFGDLPVAYAHVRKALEIDPHEAYLLSNLGIILKRNGQLEDAARAFETALQCDPDQPVPLNNLYYLHHLAENLMEERRYHEAIDLLEKAIRIEDEEYRFHYALAQSQFEVGLQQPARASLQRAIELVPDQQGTVRLTLPEGS